MKKWLRIWLIILWFLLILWLIFTLLTKGFKFRSSERNNCWPDKKYNWKDEDCYEKCINWCSSYENCPRIMGWDCHNECTLMCETPKYENCVSKCKDLEVDWYDEQHYYERFEQTKPYLNNRREYDERLEKKGIKNATLPEKYKYDEWIKDTFTWNKREIEEYESCKSTCWEEPRIIPWN